MVKKPMKTIRLLTFAFVLSFLANIVPTSVSAQGKAPNQTVAWYAEYTLTIKGKGKQEGEFDGDPDIEWKIDRTYYSNFQLTKLAPTKSGVVYSTQFRKANPLTVKVTIADELKITKKGRYQHDSVENTTSITKWEEDKVESGEAPDFQLFINPGSRYDISFVALPYIKEKNLLVGKATAIERSSAGFGEKPTSETLLEKPIFLSVTSLAVPMARGTISLSGVMGQPVFTSNRDGTPWPATYPGLIVYDSKDVEPDAPLIPGVPDSKTNLKIRVICRLSTTPIYELRTIPKMKNQIYKFTQIAILIVLVVISFNAVSAQKINSPADRVKSFYSWYLRSIIAGPDTDKAVMISHLSKRFGRWLYSKAGESRDYDPFTNGQDFNNAWVNHIVIDKVTTVGTKATVNLILGSPNNDWNMLMTISLVKESGTWKIDRARGTKTTR